MTLEQGQVPESQSTPTMAIVPPMGEHTSINEHDSDATVQVPSIIFESIEVDVCYVLPYI